MNPVITSQTIPSELRAKIRIPYAMRRIPVAHFAQLAPRRATVGAGLISLARLDSIGKNTRLELVDVRAASLHEGDLLAVVLGNRYATEQFEGYARTRESSCDLLSMGGLAGKVESKHAAVADPSTLTLLGDLCDSAGHPLRLSDYVVNPLMPSHSVRLVVVVGTSMDAGKTYTAMSLIRGLAQSGQARPGHAVRIRRTGHRAGNRDLLGNTQETSPGGTRQSRGI